ncbi:MAG: efflux RND transporter permease subunit [Deltaproteobacteria bacterium]|nr:MAG: efflux RND transporter permease subunit [Deltaproteobacteria bacterium]
MIRLAIARPVGVAVGVLLVLLFGVLSLQGLPIQLTPDVSIPSITVTTRWPGAAPSEVEREILLEQEEVLKSVDGLERMIGTANDSSAELTLEFAVGTPMEEALVRTSNRLAQVPDYPESARQPVLATADTSGPPMAVLVVKSADGRDVTATRTWVEDNVVPLYERIPGVAGIRLFGGRDSEVQVRFDPSELAGRGISVAELTAAVRGELSDISGGDMSLGKRRYVVRTEVAPADPTGLEEAVLRVEPDGAVVRVGDVATVERGLRKADRYVLANGTDALAMLFDREAGSNVLEVTEEVLAETERIDREVLAPRGLTIQVVSDQRGYIRGALALVRNNIFLGGALAVIVLLVFLRSVRASAVVATAIPVSVIGTIVGMSALGRTVNVVSLAGMAFAVGMVVDNAIVVLENIDTWRRKGIDMKEAAFKGADEVWGALLASTLTTAAVFLPIIQWQDEVGELLRDVAVAITVAVLISLVVSVLVIPSFAARALSAAPPGSGTLVDLGARFRLGVEAMVRWLVQAPMSSAGLVGATAGMAMLTAALLLPPMEYLPTGNRNLLFAVVVPPTGYSVEEMYDIGQGVQEKMLPHLAEFDAQEPPFIGRTFFVALPGRGFMGASGATDDQIGGTLGLVNGILREIPGVMGFASQASLFGRSLSSARGIDVEVSGASIPELVSVGGELMGKLSEALPGARVRPTPALDLGGPELRVVPRRHLATPLGLDAADVGVAVDAFVDGRIVGELGPEGDTQLDVVVMADPGALSPSEILAMPLATPSGRQVPVSTVAEVVETLSPTTIRRVERRRAITLEVSPGDDMALETAMEIIRGKVLPNTLLPDGVDVALSGAAGKLDEAKARMGGVLLLATLISFLLLSALFEDFLAPIVILVTVPLAAAGGVLGLRAADLFLGGQTFDMMTALGFVILIGVVVNNAILIVDGSLARLRDGASLADATAEATGGRVRPIFMSTLTSLAGLLPLVLFPGSGSELYRGVGAIVLGGLALSTALTLFIVPALFGLTWRLRGRAS